MSNIYEAISFNDFSAKYAEESESEITQAYTQYLIERRQLIADAVGIHAQDLHYFLAGVALEPVKEEVTI